MRSILTLRPAALLVATMAATACGSSSTTITSPAQAERCGITLNTGAASVPAAGGNGSISVTATRECAWSATADAAWLSIRSGANGQGEGVVQFAAIANPDPQVRTGAIVVNGSRAQITQAAGECVMALGSPSADLSPAGGTARVEVRASSSLCAWTASSEVPWITISEGASGRGTGTVTLSVAPTTGPPRTASITIAGQQFAVTQSQGCTYTIDRTSHGVSSAGGSGSLAVGTTAACPWTAASNVDWITLTPSAGSGPGSVAFSIAATQGPQRVGTAVIAGHVFTVTQSPGCAFEVQPATVTVGASGGNTTVTVTTGAGCPWTAVSNAPWITIQGAAGDHGSGSLTFSVAASEGAGRSGTLTVAGQQVTVTQTQGCTFAISPENQSVPSAGGTVRVTVTAGTGCAWTAASSVPWVTITSGANGSGNGEVQLAVAATTGPSRSATLTIAGRPFVVSQGEGCSYALSADRHAAPPEGGPGSVQVAAAAGCAWSASSNVPWITITSGGSGSGSGTVAFSVAPNTGGAREGTLTVAGVTFTVTQPGGCSYTIRPTEANVGAAGETVEVDVLSGGGCSWTAVSQVPWIVVSSGATGNNNGRVRLAVQANAGAARTGTVTIATHTFTVNQAGGCSFTVAPDPVPPVPAGGGTVRLDVTTSSTCGWTATSNADWLTVPPNAGGTGAGAVDLTAAPNTGAQRTATVTIAGRQITVTQEASAPPPCTYTLAPTAQTIPLTGGTGTITVTATAGCTWTASVSDPAWITVTSGGSGSGDGIVQFSVTASAAPRTGTITIGGQIFTISQQ